MPVGAVMAASFAGALVSGVAQGGGIQFHANAVGFKFARLNPVTNLGNLFSLRSTVRVLKGLVPATAMVALGWNAWKTLLMPSPVLSLTRLPATFSVA